MVVQKENVCLKIAIQHAYTLAEIQKNQDFLMPRIIANMEHGIMIKLVKEIATNQLENVKLYALQANTNAKETTQCFAKTDFGKKTKLVLTDAIYQLEDANYPNAFLLMNTNAQETFQCVAKMDFGKITNLV